MHKAEKILLCEFVDALRQDAVLAATARGVTLAVTPIAADIMIEGDRQILTAVMMNLLLNAFKFTAPHSEVVLRVGGGADRVHIEIEDRCGGLATTDTEELFRPFEQRGTDRTGLGLGLAFSRWGVEANHGRVYARTLPGVGCVFTVDLPRIASAALAFS